MTRRQIESFVRLRNRSPAGTRSEFDADAATCGFAVEELGAPRRVEDRVVAWTTPFGTLVERHGKLMLEPAS